MNTEERLSDMEMNILSRLAMLKAANNIGKRFHDALSLLSGAALIIGTCIKNGDKSNLSAKSLLEWGKEQVGKNKKLQEKKKKPPKYVDDMPEKLSDVKIYIENLIKKYGESARLVPDAGFNSISWMIEHE